MILGKVLLEGLQGMAPGVQRSCGDWPCLAEQLLGMPHPGQQSALRELPAGGGPGVLPIVGFSVDS